jgi:GNAT superfamily N-acetyltransferase
MHVTYLADHEHLIPELAQLHFEEWSHLRPEETLQGRIARLHSCCGKGSIPTVFVALLGTDLCGSAMLVTHDLESRPELTPWLAGVYVKPQYRHRGFAALLIARIVEEARVLAVPRLYLYTPSTELLYEHLGWSVIEHCNLQGVGITIMSKALMV